MDDGYLKLWRCSMESQVWNNDGLWKVWCWCLMRASYKERWVPVTTGSGSTEVLLKPGQFIFGRNTAAKKLGMKPSTIKKRMDKLEKIGNINIQSNSHYSIVSVCSWEKFQPPKKEKEQAE